VTALDTLREIRESITPEPGHFVARTRKATLRLLDILIREREEPPMLQTVAQCQSCKGWIPTRSPLDAVPEHECPGYPAPLSSHWREQRAIEQSIGRIEDKLDWLIARWRFPEMHDPPRSQPGPIGKEREPDSADCFVVPEDLRQAWPVGTRVYMAISGNRAEGKVYVVQSNWAMEPEVQPTAKQVGVCPVCNHMPVTPGYCGCPCHHGHFRWGCDTCHGSGVFRWDSRRTFQEAQRLHAESSPSCSSQPWYTGRPDLVRAEQPGSITDQQQPDQPRDPQAEPKTR
jgi:hypothetical protein